MDLADCYRLLGLRTGASYEDIKASYRRLARQYHPDTNPGNQQQAEKFIRVTEAYRVLISVVKPAADTPAVNLKQNRRAAVEQPPATPAAAPSFRNNPHLSPTEHELKQTAYTQLQQLLRERRFPRAIALVEGLAQRLGGDAEVRQWQAITYQRFGRYLIANQQPEKAKIYLQKALRTDPHNKSLWYEVDRDLRQIDAEWL